jgi:hypothetical protein
MAIMFVAITIGVAIPLVVVLVGLTFVVAATWGSKPTGAMKVLVAIWTTLIYPGEVLRPLVGENIIVASALVWGLLLASFSLIARQLFIARQSLLPGAQKVDCVTCGATGWILVGSLRSVCSACGGQGWRSPPNTSLERTRER